METSARPPRRGDRGRGDDAAPKATCLEGLLGAKDRTPEIDTSEIVVDDQWRFPMDVQCFVPKATRPEGLAQFVVVIVFLRERHTMRGASV